MIRACALMDLPPGEAVRIVGPHAPIAVFNAGGTLYAIDDTRTHQARPSVRDGTKGASSRARRTPPPSTFAPATPPGYPPKDR